MLNDELEKVNTNDFLKQNATSIFRITYHDSNLSKFWDDFYFFINSQEGTEHLNRNKNIDADTVLMNPELKKTQWLIHLTPTEENALGIVKNGFKYGLNVNQMSKLGYSNRGVEKDSKKGKYLYAFNAEEISDNIFPTSFYVKDKERHKYQKPFDQKTWEYASQFAIMFTAPGIQSFHGTDRQNQVIFNADMAHNYVLLTRDEEFQWNVITKEGKSVYNNPSLTDTVKWVIDNFDQYRRKICWKR